MGGTSDIGESTAREFLCHPPYLQTSRLLIGRSSKQAATLKTEFIQLNPESNVQFIQNDVLLLGNVDEVCDEIKSREDKVNLLVLCAGIMTQKDAMRQWRPR